jgi:hypothetical protein
VEDRRNRSVVAESEDAHCTVSSAPVRVGRTRRRDDVARRERRGRLMSGFTLMRPTPRAARATAPPVALSHRVFVFMTAVVVIQGGHVVEHIVQMLQVFVLDVPEDRALGLLGYVLQFNGTEEWLHLGFNLLYLLSLYALIVPLWRISPAVLPKWAFGLFLAGSVWVESWHIVEHGVIISHVIANGGCPCPGIGDAALSVSDTLLHFFYNAIAYTGVAVAFAIVARERGFVLRRNS